MKKYIYPDRFLQIAILLLFTASVCFVAQRQPDPFEKRAGSAVLEETKHGHSALSRQLCVGKIRKSREETDSFGALYGLYEYDVPEKVLDFDILRRDENPHIYAWITIPGTVIDYPVVQHPEQPDYYLTHNLDGKTGYPGGIYTQPANSRDWTDNQTVIYGHNMRDGTMFAALHNYEEEAFLEEYPYIYIYTEDTIKVYRIFAAYPFSDEHLLLEFHTETQEDYEEYLRLVMDAASKSGHYAAEAAPAAGEPIITLSTCIADKPAQRYLVQAVLEAEGTRIQ